MRPCGVNSPLPGGSARSKFNCRRLSSWRWTPPADAQGLLIDICDFRSTKAGSGLMIPRHREAQGTIQFVALKGFRQRRHTVKTISNPVGAVTGCEYERNM